MRIKITVVFAIIFLSFGNRQTLRATFDVFYETEATFLFCFDKIPKQISGAAADGAISEAVEKQILFKQECRTRIWHSFVFNGNFVFENVGYFYGTSDFEKLVRVVRLGIKLTILLSGEFQN